MKLDILGTSLWWSMDIPVAYGVVADRIDGALASSTAASKIHIIHEIA
jgi:hypothetical protein